MSRGSNPLGRTTKIPSVRRLRGLFLRRLKDSPDVIGPSTSLSSRDPLDVYPVTVETPTNKSTQRPCGRFAHAAALLVIFSVVLIAPLQSLAQLPLPLPLPGSLVVTLTSPRSGSTVGGTTPVTARVTIIGSLIVRSVQFKLDGGNLAGQDTNAPYAVPADTSTAGDGAHRPAPPPPAAAPA